MSSLDRHEVALKDGMVLPPKGVIVPEPDLPSWEGGTSVPPSPANDNTAITIPTTLSGLGILVLVLLVRRLFFRRDTTKRDE